MNKTVLMLNPNTGDIIKVDSADEALGLLDEGWKAFRLVARTASGFSGEVTQESVIPANDTPQENPYEDFISPLLPPTFDTVLGYLAKTNPEALDLIEDVANDTCRDGFWLKHQAESRGLRVVKVKAPKVLQDKGIHEVNAYPVSLLAERLG